jgi:hypothetical protein
MAAVLSTPLAALPAEVAAQNVAANNLVNVQIGNVEVAKNVNVAAAVQLIAQVCGNQISVAALAEQVAAGEFTGTCDANGQDIIA